jgi:hypothetical protein
MKKIIPGIYVYCDRWCEMCGHTIKCEAYSGKPETQNQDHDLLILDFWSELESDKFYLEILEKKNETLSDKGEKKDKTKFDLFQKGAKSNPLLILGRKYEDLVDDWFDYAIENYGLNIVETENGAMPMLDITLARNKKYNEMFEIVLRYQLQIYLKLSRMFFSKGRQKEINAKGEEADNPTGVARTTLELLSRSIRAWGVLSKKYPGDKTIEEMIFIINDLRSMILLEFPDSETFKRPGLG